MSKKILSIDDDHVFGLVVQKLFENDSSDHRVITKTSVNEGIHYLQEISIYQYPDIILVDVNMPNGGAFQFLEKYKSLGLEIYSASLFFISSSVFPEDERKVSQSEIVKGIFRKPFDQSQVSMMLT